LPSNPLVSILINNYNYGRFIQEAISSALAQSYGPVEVVVVDDGSTDNSRAVIASFGNRVVPVLKQNGGQASAFNAGFAACKGEIICFLDSDDLFAPDKVTEIVKIYGENPQIGWCFEKMVLFDHNSGERHSDASGYTLGLWDARKALAAGRPPHIATATSGISFRRTTLERILPMPESIRITSDGFLKLAALALIPGWNAVEGLTLQRIHGENLYTGRKDGKKRQVGKLGILIAAALADRFPDLKRLEIVLFSRGLGLCWISGGFDSECRHLTRTFLGKLPILNRTEVVLRAVYSGARNLNRPA
jgi:glycosyltransferase involved in cell wall biosynthesis